MASYYKIKKEEPGDKNNVCGGNGGGDGGDGDGGVVLRKGKLTWTSSKPRNNFPKYLLCA